MKNFVARLQENFNELTKNERHIFTVDVDKDEMWELYLSKIPTKYNPIYRKRQLNDCSECRRVIKNIGNIVAIKDNKMVSIWDFDVASDEYQDSINALRDLVMSKAVSNVFGTKEFRIGVPFNYEMTDNGEVKRWDHLSLTFRKELVKFDDTYVRNYAENRTLLKRALEELTPDSIETTLSLIKEKKLERGSQWQISLKNLQVFQKQYFEVDLSLRDLFLWSNVDRTLDFCRIRNTSIGTLLVNLSEGMDLSNAVFKYQNTVDPTKYRRVVAVYSENEARKAFEKLVSLGYEESLGREFATLDDISVNNLLFCDRNILKAKTESKSVLDLLLESTKTSKVNDFDNLKTMFIDDFIKNVLPKTSSMEAYFSEKHRENLVSLIAPKNKTAKSLLKWDNGFSWAYSGNITSSAMARRVSEAGGKVDGALRFSIQWNDTEKYDNVDLDAHAQEPLPNGSHIYFGQHCSNNTVRVSGKKSKCGGILDVDRRRCLPDEIAVENIIWESIDNMIDGEYVLYVHAYGGTALGGFRAEVAFGDKIYSFNHDKPIHNNKTVNVATVVLKDGVFTLKSHLPQTEESKKLWNVKVNDFVPVSALMLSPNYWDSAVGNKHHFFMLNECISNENPNGFFNEFLANELNEHKRVFESLGEKMAVASSEKQLSGIGFSEGKNLSLVVRVTDNQNNKQLLKITF